MHSIQKLLQSGLAFSHAGPVVQPMSWVRCVLAAAVLLCVCQPSWAEYRLDSGDVLEISVLGIPELQRRVPIQVDGHISFPLVEALHVAGLPLSQVRARVKASLASKIFKHRNSDGLENAVVIAADDVTTTVVAYRPIYMKGDVSKPGEYAFRASMTVRQAIALAGGYNILPLGVSNPFLQSIELRGEYEGLWIEFAKEQARVWRLKSELEKPYSHDGQIDAAIDIEAPIPRSTIERIIELTTEQLAARRTDNMHQRTLLEQSIKQTGEQIRVISEQYEKEKEGSDADTEDLKRALDLYKKGSLTNIRVTAARRAVLLSSTRVLQTSAQLMQMRSRQGRTFRTIAKTGRCAQSHSAPGAGTRNR